MSCSTENLTFFLLYQISLTVYEIIICAHSYHLTAGKYSWQKFVEHFSTNRKAEWCDISVHMSRDFIVPLRYEWLKIMLKHNVTTQNKQNIVVYDSFLIIENTFYKWKRSPWLQKNGKSYFTDGENFC